MWGLAWATGRRGPPADMDWRRWEPQQGSEKRPSWRLRSEAASPLLQKGGHQILLQRPLLLPARPRCRLSVLPHEEALTAAPEADASCGPTVRLPVQRLIHSRSERAPAHPVWFLCPWPPPTWTVEGAFSWRAHG